jgi:putative ABC transport system permease protein
MLIDRATRADFGPKNGRTFEAADVGSEVMLSSQRMRIAGLVSIGTGLAANGQVLVGQSAFAKLVPWNANENCSLGLVRLKPGADPELVSRRLNVLLRDGNRPQGMVEVISRREALARETKRWIDQTPIGAIFQMGVLLALMVGATVVYQVLSTDIANRMPEYATLKAMGHSSIYLSSLVLFQAWYLAILSFIPAWLLSEGLYRVTAWSAGIPITMTMNRITWVACSGIAICTLSALAALNKIRKAEPAALF